MSYLCTYGGEYEYGVVPSQLVRVLLVQSTVRSVLVIEEVVLSITVTSRQITRTSIIVLLVASHTVLI